LESRLAAALGFATPASQTKQTTQAGLTGATPDTIDQPAAEVVHVTETLPGIPAEMVSPTESPVHGNGTESESINVWPDEAAEASFRAEARERGESITPVALARPPVEAAEADETNPKNLPPLETLVNRLSPEVRETLDDLFRAKFTMVRRVPKQSLKS
jgi:hypothetical protein